MSINNNVFLGTVTVRNHKLKRQQKATYLLNVVLPDILPSNLTHRYIFDLTRESQNEHFTTNPGFLAFISSFKKVDRI